MLQAEEQHRDHAVIEQAFADWTDGPMAYLPSGRLPANAAWLTLAAITHNLLRAAGCLASPFYGKARGATIRADLIDVAARIARHGRGHLTLHLPHGWHRQHDWLALFRAGCGPPAAGGLTSPNQVTHRHPPSPGTQIPAPDKRAAASPRPAGNSRSRPLARIPKMITRIQSVELPRAALGSAVVREQAFQSLPQRSKCAWMAVQSPVLVVDAAMLGDIEPHEPGKMVVGHTSDQPGDLARLSRNLPDADLGQQHRVAGDPANLPELATEDVTERIRPVIVVPVDAYPVHVTRARPVCAERAGVFDVVAHRPQPDHAVRALAAEHGHDVPPGGDECRRGLMCVAPRVPVAVHLVGEADYCRVPEHSHLMGITAQPAVVRAGGYHPERYLARVDLDEHGCAVAVCRFGERYREPLPDSREEQHKAGFVMHVVPELLHRAERPGGAQLKVPEDGVGRVPDAGHGRRGHGWRRLGRRRLGRHRDGVHETDRPHEQRRGRSDRDGGADDKPDAAHVGLRTAATSTPRVLVTHPCFRQVTMP